MLIPIFDSFVYPLLAKCNILTKPLTRIFAGGVLAGVAFLISGFLELRLEVCRMLCEFSYPYLHVIILAPMHVLPFPLLFFVSLIHLLSSLAYTLTHSVLQCKRTGSVFLLLWKLSFSIRPYILYYFLICRLHIQCQSKVWKPDYHLSMDFHVMLH